MEHRGPFTGPGSAGYKPPLTAARMREIIREIRDGIRSREAYTPLRDNCASVASREHYAESMRQANSALSCHEYDGHGPGETKAECLTPEEAEHRVAHFEKVLRGAGLSAEQIADKLRWFRSSHNIAGA